MQLGLLSDQNAPHMSTFNIRETLMLQRLLCSISFPRTWVDCRHPEFESFMQNVTFSHSGGWPLTATTYILMKMSAGHESMQGKVCVFSLTHLYSKVPIFLMRVWCNLISFLIIFGSKCIKSFHAWLLSGSLIASPCGWKTHYRIS